MPDQDILNIVFDGRWFELDPRWNAQFKLWEDPDSASEYFGAAAEMARREPAIVHFEGPSVLQAMACAERAPAAEEVVGRPCGERRSRGPAPGRDVGRALRLLPRRACIAGGYF